MADRHDWNSWDGYLSIHQARLRAFESFVLEDGLDAILSESRVRWRGTLRCSDGIEIHVQKIQQVQYQRGRPMVRTIEYSYHVLQRIGDRVRSIVRYDNIGEHGSDDPHHRHRFDESGVESTVEPVGVEG